MELFCSRTKNNNKLWVIIMSYWIELHCDSRVSSKCVTDVGGAYGLMARNAKSSIHLAKNMLASKALVNGWVKKGNQFICPRCKNYSAEKK